MAVLLDTHIMIWMEEEPARLSSVAKERIESELFLFFSTASVWEMAIKVKTGKLSLKQPLPQFIESFRRGYEAQYIPISFRHIYHTQQLPIHHRDPFDRLLIAQALTENLSVISSDAVWDAYGVNRIWS